VLPKCLFFIRLRWGSTTMKCIGLSFLLGITVLLVGCSSQTAPSDPFGQYNRQSVCANLSQQLQFNNDRGYQATNQGASQIQYQQLLASYKANGCDK
jgi:hypothetical protein